MYNIVNNDNNYIIHKKCNVFGVHEEIIIMSRNIDLFRNYNNELIVLFYEGAV